ncbi:MAG: HAMP domain-containing protein [Gemmatimonadales bacterium]|nr:HAMP domain-containing protein [Gemmatimonadota bacterium]MCL4214598.1 HAMP domain-containing protein [Gemmatimonadales bacterium]
MRLTQRLLLGAFLVVGFLAVFIVALVDRQLGTRLREDAVTFLEREAVLVGVSWARETLHPDSLADRAGEALGRRVTLIRTDGVVVGDAAFDGDALAALQNHAARPEVVAALAGEVGTARRASISTGATELYVAVPVRGLGVARVSLPTAGLDGTIRSARQEVLLGVLVALALALLLALLFSRAVSRPVEELRDVAQALADGDLTRRPVLHAPGEVGELAAALRSLAEQLSARLRALEAEEALLSQLIESRNEAVIAVDTAQRVVRMNETARRLLDVREPLPFPVDLLPRDVALRDALLTAFAGGLTESAEVEIGGRTLTVTARPLADGGAVLALFDLTTVRRLEAVRRDFVANVSHELRTPLTVIGGFAETLQADDIPPTDRREFASRILGNTQRMQRIVDDLLDLSRIESGGWVPNPGMVDLGAVAADVLAAARDAAGAKGLTLAAEIARDAGTVYADATALRQVLGNLVDNGVRHTPSGSVTLFSERDPRGVRIGVRDTGVGIAPAHLSRIFERFYRVDPGRSREQGGTGLGLAIVRHLVEAHGGRVTAESALGRGTTITVFFPSRKA